MFEKRLSDLVKGIRNNKKNESIYINQSIQEIKVELKSPDYNIKSQAVLKLTYLLMLGYDMNWAAFNVIEVMSQSRFEFKRIGYLAASLAFDDTTEVSMLSTQLIRKDMASTQYEAGVALNCLANIVTHDLGEDLAADVVATLNTSRNFVRKKAVLVLYKIFLKYPEALRPAWPRLKEKLEDPDMQVVASAVTVVCELARKNAKNYISLSPILFKLLNISTNNWMLIKIVKLFGQLIPLEKRLTKKLIEPLSNIINTTPAMSLLYECIRTCTTTELNQNLPLVRLCITKLKTFIEDPDQNLKYLGLSALCSVMEEHPKAVSEHRDMVVVCLDDPDLNIRNRALDLLTGMVSKKNLTEIIQKLLDKLDFADGGWKDNLVEKIVYMCSNNNYALVRDFEWYLTVLTELSRVSGTCHGKLIASQFMDVAIRVKVVRQSAVATMAQLLRDPRLLSETDPNSNSMVEVLSAAAWIAGEFIEHSESPLEIVSSLLQARVLALPSHIQSIYMQNLLKIFSYMLKKEQNSPSDETEEVGSFSEKEDTNVLNQLFKEIHDRIPPFIQSTNLEVQERSCFFYSVVKMMEENRKSGASDLSVEELSSFFEEQLHPVAPKVQLKVPIPDGLDLETQINDPPAEVSDDEDDEYFTDASTIFPVAKKIHYDDDENEHSTDNESDNEEEKKKKETKMAKYLEEKKQIAADLAPYYLNSPTKPKPTPDAPITELTNSELGLIAPSPLKGLKPKTKRPQVSYEVENIIDAPEGVDIEDVKPKKKNAKAKAKAEQQAVVSDDPLANMDLNTALKPGEQLLVRTHRIVQTSKAAASPEGKRKKKKKTEEAAEVEQQQEEAPTKGEKGKKKKKGEKGKKKKEQQPTNLIDSFSSMSSVTSMSSLSSTSSSGISNLSSSTSSSSSFQSFQNSKVSDSIPSTTSSFAPTSFFAPLTNTLTSFLPSSADPVPPSSTTGLLGITEYKPHDLPNKSTFSPADDFFGSSSKKPKKNKAGEKPKKKKKTAGLDEATEKPKKKKKQQVDKEGDLLGANNEEPETKKVKEKEKEKEKKKAKKSTEPQVQTQKSVVLVPKAKKLFGDEKLKATYETSVSLNESNRFYLTFNFSNSSSGPLQVNLKINGTLNLKVIQPPPGIGVASQSSAVSSGILQVTSLATQKLDATISYNDVPPQKVTLAFGCSTFIVPVKLDREQFQTLLSSTSTPMTLNSTIIKVTDSSTLQSTAELLSAALNLAIIDTVGQAVCLYGSSIQKHHVCVLLKQKTPTSMSIDFKSTDGSISAGLSQEAKEFFANRNAPISLLD